MWHQYIWAIYESNKLFTLVEYMCISGDAAAWVFKKAKSYWAECFAFLDFPSSSGFLAPPPWYFFPIPLNPKPVLSFVFPSPPLPAPGSLVTYGLDTRSDVWLCWLHVSWCVWLDPESILFAKSHIYWQISLEIRRPSPIYSSITAGRPHPALLCNVTSLDFTLACCWCIYCTTFECTAAVN